MEENLKLCPLFFGISSIELNALIENVDFKVKQYKKNEIVVNENDLCDKMIIITKGTVRGEMTDYSGKVIKIEDIGTSRPLAPAFLFGKNNRYPVSIISNEDVEITIFSQEMVLKLFRLNQMFLVNFLNMISNRAQFLSQKIKFLSFQTIKGKIAHYLLQFASTGNTREIKLPSSQKEISELFGVTRPALGRAMRELDNEGMIRANGKDVEIIDGIRLKKLLR
jgi:CRP-like cAMP-binding protein